MILHIVTDEKFIDMAYMVFERASPNNNEFMLVSNKRTQLKYIKNTPITLISLYKFLTKEFAHSLKKYDFVIFHSLFDQDIRLQLIMNSDERIKFVWIGWGGDYYNLLDRKLYLEKTSDLFRSVTKKNKISMRQKIKNFFKKKIFLRDINDKQKAINRINYFAPVLEEEYFLVKNSFKNFKPKFIDWNYATLNEVLGSFIDTRISGNNILIGNSATFENNHLEAFDMVRKLNIEKREIIVPLSYGIEIYKNDILKHGKDIFKNNFYPLIDFMPLNKYNKIISTCSIVVMNQLRQQAGTNIVIMMYLGAKVFLNKENLFYQFYKNRGAIIFSIDELNNDNICNNLTDDEVEINRNVIRNMIGEDVIMKKTKNLIDIVIKD